MKLSNLTKKILIILISSFYFLTSSFMPFAVAKAQEDEPPSTWYNQNPIDWYNKVYVDSPPSEIFGERYTAAQVQWILFSLITVPFSTLETFNTANGGEACMFGMLAGAAAIPTCVASYISSVTKVLGSLGITQAINVHTEKFATIDILRPQNREVSAINYVKKSLSRFTLVKSANAQEGFGYGAIGIVQNLWSASRNAAYGLIVLITIIFAFMIMFRVKLSPQIVISVQAALPKLFGALILATFSFAIAGLMVDLMYVFTGFIAAILAAAFNNTSAFSFIYGFITGEWVGVHVSSFLVVFLYMVLYTILFILSVLVSLAAAISSWSVFGSILAILFILVAVWLIILCFWYMIKVPWMLIKALASIYMSVVVAPLQIILGAVAPQIGFTQWLRGLVANLLVFPVTGLFFFLAYLVLFQSMMAGLEVGFERNVISELLRAFGWLDIQGVLPGNLWSPPLLGTGAEISGLILALMSFMIIVAIPKVTEIVKMLVLGAKFDYGSAIGEAMGAFGILPTAQKVGADAAVSRVGYEIGSYAKDKATANRDSKFWQALTEWAKKNKYIDN